MARSLHFKFPLCSPSFQCTAPLSSNCPDVFFHRFFRFTCFRNLQSPIQKCRVKAGAKALHPSSPRKKLDKEDESDYSDRDLDLNGLIFQKTLRLVECAMFAAVTGLVYFLSNSLSLENYFGCFFSFPIVISSLRWGIDGGRKTMVATAMLLFVLSGPVKALVYLMTHGLVGFTMGSFWRLGVDWRVSIFWCTIARAAGAVGYVLVSSFLIRENILALITMNIHASLSFIFAATGVNIIPAMKQIYILFGTLVLLNSGFFVFLLHLLYAIFATRMGMRDSLRLPKWLQSSL